MRRGGATIDPLRLIFWGMSCGLTEREAWKTNPVRVLKLAAWKRQYDMRLHGIVERKER